MPIYPTPITSRKHGTVLNLVASQNTDIPCLGAAMALVTVLQAGSTSNHTFSVSTHQGDQWTNVPAEQFDGTYHGPGVTVAFSADKVYMVPLTGAVALRIATAASSTASVVVSLLTAAEAQAFRGSASTIRAESGWSVQVTPTVGTAAYIAGDVIGGVLTFANAASASGRAVRVEKLSIIDKSQQSIPCTLQLFSATPAGGTYTDGSALVYHANDYALYQSQIRLLAGDWLSYPATPTDSFVAWTGSSHVNLAATSLFGLLIADGSFSLTNGDLIINIGGVRL